MTCGESVRNLCIPVLRCDYRTCAYELKQVRLEWSPEGAIPLIAAVSGVFPMPRSAVSLLWPWRLARRCDPRVYQHSTLSPHLTAALADYPPSTESSTGTLFRVACE